MKYFKECELCNIYKPTHAVLSPFSPGEPAHYNGNGERLSGTTRYLCCSCYRLLDHTGNRSHTHECCRKAKAIRDALDTIRKARTKGGILRV